MEVAVVLRSKKLEHLPRVGKNTSLPFIKAITKTNWFYVEEILKSIEDAITNKVVIKDEEFIKLL